MAKISHLINISQAETLPAKWSVPFDNGASVFPLTPNRKTPLGSWCAYQRERAPRSSVETWAKQNYNVGIVTGAVSGLLVLDLDNESALKEAMRRGLPDTVTAKTPRGWHFYFAHPGRTVKNRASIFDGADIRGDGGYVVAPGSHFTPDAKELADGKVEGDYEWIDGKALGKIELAPMPEWLVELCKTPDQPALSPANDTRMESYAASALAGELDNVRNARQGERNAQLNTSALKLAKLEGHLPANARGQLADAARSAGLELDEIEATINSGWQAGLREPITTLPDRDEKQQPANDNLPIKISATPFQWRDPSTIPARQWIYGSSLLRGSLSLIIAPGASGKTALTGGLALSLATGRDLLGKTVWGGAKRVWLWNLEDSMDELARLIHAGLLYWQISAADLADRLLIDSGLDGDGLITATAQKQGFEINQPALDALANEIAAKGIDVLIIDPFVSSHRVVENDNGAIDAVAKAWAKLAVKAHCSILIVHHSRKSIGGFETTAESSRGASSLVNAARSVLVLNKMTKDEAESMGVEESERRRFVRIYDDKNNRAPPADQCDWYKLESQSLGNAPDGGDNMPVVTPWRAPDPWDGMGLNHLRQVQAVIAEGEWRASDQVKGGTWAGNAVADVLELDVENPSHRARIKKYLVEWIKNGALKSEKRIDKNSRKEVPFIIVGRWADDESARPPLEVEQK